MKHFSLPAHLPASRTLCSAIRNQQSISTNFRKNPRLNHFRHRIFSAISFNFPLSIIKFLLRRLHQKGSRMDWHPAKAGNRCLWSWRATMGTEASSRRNFFFNFVRWDDYSPECILCSIITKAIKMSELQLPFFSTHAPADGRTQKNAVCERKAEIESIIH